VAIMKINPIHSAHIIDPGKRPKYITDQPVPRVHDVLSQTERQHQAELDAGLWAAHMKHQRNLLEIILSGNGYKES